MYFVSFKALQKSSFKLFRNNSFTDVVFLKGKNYCRFVCYLKFLSVPHYLLYFLAPVPKAMYFLKRCGPVPVHKLF